MSDDLRFYPDYAGKTLKLTASFNPENGLELRDTNIIKIKPKSPWDKYDEMYSDGILLVLLDENGQETSTMHFEPNGNTQYGLDPFAKTLDWLKNQSKNDRYNLYYGNSAYIPNNVRFDKPYWTDYVNSYLRAKKDQIKLFRYPRHWSPTGGNFGNFNYVYGFGTIVSYNQNGLQNLQTVILPETAYGKNCVVLEGNMFSRSGVSEVVFRSDEVDLRNWQTFSYCSNLKQIELPEVVPKDSPSIPSNTFYGCDGITIKLTRNSADSISGAPWGATNATVIWAN